jgi:hypothetical protein
VSNDNNNDDTARRLTNVLSYYGQSLLEASDEEILRDLQTGSEDPLKVNEEMRFAIDSAIDRFYATRATVLRERSGPYSTTIPCGLSEQTSAVEAVEAMSCVSIHDAAPPIDADASSNGTGCGDFGPCAPGQGERSS